MGLKHVYISMYVYKQKVYVYWFIGIMVRVFANGPSDHGSFPGRVIQKKKLQNGTWFHQLHTHHYKVWIKSKQSNLRNVLFTTLG